MTHAFLRLIRLTLWPSLLLPSVVIACSLLASHAPSTVRMWLPVLLLALLGASAAVGIGRWLEHREARLTELARSQASALDRWSISHVPLAIVGSAALSLFLELAVIRWQGMEW